jgi:hypothetical protein
MGLTISSPVHCLNQKPYLVYGLDNRYTVINQQNVFISGAYLGIGFDEKMKFKFGISGTPFAYNQTNQSNNKTAKSHLLFLTLGNEFDFIHFNKFSLTNYIQTGYGFQYTQNTYNNTSPTDYDINYFLPLELGLNLNYDFNPWLRAKIGGGYRFAFLTENKSLENYYLKATFTINIHKLWKKLYVNDSNSY